MVALPDKIAVPRFDIDLLPRTRVWARLDEAAQRRAIVVAGPAGYGKTIACASWLTARAAHPDPERLAWITLEASDRSPARFWDTVHAALDEPEYRLPSDDEAGRAAFLAGFVGRLAAADRPVTVVLDDLQEIRDSPVMGDLDYVLRHAPPAFRMVLISRRMPALQVARLRLAGLADAVGPEELACTPDEAEKLLALQGVCLGPAELSDLWRLTEGWIGGLRLELLGGDVATEYIRDEFLASLEPADRDFLVRTSVADQLTAELADALTGRADGAATLDRLHRDCGFVQRSTGEPASFRYHPMIRKVLRAELARDLPTSMAELNSALGRWHELQGRPEEALRCAFAAGDSGSVARLLLDHDVCLLASESAQEIEQLMVDLAARNGATDPAILTALALARLHRGDLDDARALLSQASAAVEPLDSGPATILRLKHAALRLGLAIQQGPLGRASQAAAWQAGERGAGEARREPGERRAYGWLMAVLGISHVAAGELQQGRLALTRAEREYAAAGPAHLHERVCGWLALAEAADGRLRSAERCAAQVPDASPIADLARVARAVVLVERGEPARAAELLHGVRPWPAEPALGEPVPALVLSWVQMSVRLAQGDIAGAGTALAQLSTSAGTFGDGLALAVAVHDAAIAARSHADPTARLGTVDWADSDAVEAIWPAARDLLLAWHAADDDPAHALRIVAELREHRNGSLRLRDQISAQLVSAVANWRLGERQVATGQLEEALALAEPEAARQVFVDGGHGARALLTVALPVESRFAGFRAEILQRFDRALPTVEPCQEPGGALTASERAVLRFLPSHLTNEEIAEDLCLSVNTVKTHLRSIYRKLGVSSRRAAIASADHHGLLLAGAA